MVVFVEVCIVCFQVLCPCVYAGVCKMVCGVYAGVCTMVCGVYTELHNVYDSLYSGVHSETIEDIG